MKTGPKPQPPIDRFLKYVHKQPNGCWIWKGAKTVGGYGIFYRDPSRKLEGAHRWSYEHYKGPIPAGLFVCHTCDTKPCVNPEHLFVGTNSENILDAVRKGLKKPTPNKGSSNGRAVLTNKQVLRIRALYGRNGWDGPTLAKRYGVSSTQIYWVVQRKSWAHL